MLRIETSSSIRRARNCAWFITGLFGVALLLQLATLGGSLFESRRSIGGAVKRLGVPGRELSLTLDVFSLSRPLSESNFDAVAVYVNDGTARETVEDNAQNRTLKYQTIVRTFVQEQCGGLLPSSAAKDRVLSLANQSGNLRVEVSPSPLGIAIRITLGALLLVGTLTAASTAMLLGRLLREISAHVPLMSSDA